MDDFVHEASDLCLVREVYLEPSDSSELNGIPTVQIMEAPADTNTGTTVCPQCGNSAGNQDNLAFHFHVDPCVIETESRFPLPLRPASCRGLVK